MIEVAKKDPLYTQNLDKQMLIDVETMSLLFSTASKGMGNPVYETMNLQITRDCFSGLLDSLLNLSQSDFVILEPWQAVEF
jgi:hypothetical protein